MRNATDTACARARWALPIAAGLLLVLGVESALAADDLDALARQLVAEHAEKIRPLEIEAARRYWEANVSGTDDTYRLKNDADARLDATLADREFFRRIKLCHEAKLADPLVGRQIQLLYWQALPKQIAPELLQQLVVRANGVERRFNAFRATVGEEQLTAGDVRRILRESTDSARRRAVWEASKVIGAELAPELLALVKLRNLSARQLGFADYHTMLLALNEQDPDEVLRLFNEVDALTREPYLAVKREIDARLAERCRVTVAELRPWHYHDPFFRDAPMIGPGERDEWYARVDIVDLCRRFYAGIGLPVDSVLARSDLHERPGKHPSAFCLDIDRSGDVRVLANIVPTEAGLRTLLHELGHAVYSSGNMPADLPYLLRCESHLLTTEGLATMFERLASDAEWLTDMGIGPDDPAALRATMRSVRRNKLLVFSRWSQVVFRFERELYRDPDQDLNRLWWGLVESYQQVTPPNGRDLPDYASQLHIATAPAYFHNYLLGWLFACQLRQTIARDVLHAASPQTAAYVGQAGVGEFLRERVFAPGRRLSWNELTRYATGEELSVAAFADDIAE